VQDGERARIGVDRHAKRLRHAVSGDVTVGRSDPAGGEDVAPELVKCVDDRDTTHNSCDQDGRSPEPWPEKCVTLYGESHGADDFDTFCR